MNLERPLCFLFVINILFPVFFQVNLFSGLTHLSQPLSISIALLSFIIISFSVAEPATTITIMEKIMLSGLCLLSIAYFINHSQSAEFLLLFGLVVFYLLFKNLIQSCNKEKVIQGVYCNYIFILSAMITIFIIYSCNKSNAINTFFYPNKSIFAILLASQITFVIPLGFDQIKVSTSYRTLKKIIFFSAVVCGLLLLLLTEGRAGWFGFLLSALFLVIIRINNPEHRKRIVGLSALVGCFLFIALLFYKPGSSKGRILINKVSWNMITDNWLTGVGYGRFKVKYNLYQSQYFREKRIDSSESMLADNTYFAFNEFIQLFSETGVAGLILFIALVLITVRSIKKNKAVIKCSPLLKGAIASLLVIMTGSLFSYPFQIIPIAVQLILCLAILNVYLFKSNKIAIEKKHLGFALKFFFSAGCIFLIYHAVSLFGYKVKSQKAFELSESGFRNRAIEMYSDLRNSYLKDGNILYLYSKELISSNRLGEAKEVLTEAKKYYTSTDLYKLSASLSYELNDIEAAEKDYLTVVYMVPDKILSRFDLLNFYIQTNQKEGAIIWAKSILEMKIKVPTTSTDNIKAKTRELLNNLSR